MSERECYEVVALDRPLTVTRLQTALSDTSKFAMAKSIFTAGHEVGFVRKPRKKNR